MSIQSGSRRLRATLGTTRGWRRRVLVHHIPLAVGSGLGLLVFTELLPSHGRSISIFHLVVSTGYVALVLLALTLLIGPVNLLLRRRNPVSTYLRRDVGAWTAVMSVIHVILGFETHGGGGAFSFVDFFFVDGRPLLDSFGLGNWTGLAATVIVVGLLVISTDRSMRELKATRWKNLQRLNYTLFGLVVLHAVFYGALRRMTSPLTVLLVSTVVAVFLAQAAGIWLWRRRHRQREQRRAELERSTALAR